jgi:hypothetical protein
MNQTSEKSERKSNLGRPNKYDFSSLEKVGDSIEFFPEGKAFNKRTARNISAALVQWRRKYKPSYVCITRSVLDESGRICKVVVILVSK